MNSKGNNKLNFEHLCSLADDVFTGAWWVKNQLEESEKSRLEQGSSDGVREVCEGVAETLDNWKPDLECESADEFVFDLADYLEEHTDWEVEVQPDTPYGKPDLLVGDKLVLELNINPDKGERGRIIAQCADYSRQWVTWIILIGANPSLVGQLNQLLISKGLERILVWNFS